MTGRVVVVGLGPAGPELVSEPAREALRRAGHRYVRTLHHPAAGSAAPARSFDDLYESSATREDVYEGIAATLTDAAHTWGEVVYAVPGSPLVLERSVAILRGDPGVEVELIPGLSFLDLAWDRLGLDPVSAGVRLVDGEAFAVQAAGERGPLLVAHCWARHVLSDIKLAVEEEPDEPVTVLQRLGLPDESVFTVPWADLDRAVDPDHLTSLFVPSLSAPVGAELARLGELIRTLRQRCPWDRQQTHASLTRHLIEETYEVLDAIDNLDGAEAGGYGALEEELGDLLVQVYFHATLAAEQGQFNLADVARRVHDKLVGRHPHVFGSVRADSPEHVIANWERIKRAEKGRASVMDGIPARLPALLGAAKVLAKARATGANRRSPAANASRLLRATEAVAAGVERPAAPDPAPSSPAAPGAAPAEPAARHPATAVGEALLALVALAGDLGVDPEAALRVTTKAYTRRFAGLETRARDRGVELAELEPDELAELWG